MAGRILIADSAATRRISLRAILTTARYDIAVADNAQAALQLAAETRPDLILVGESLGTGLLGDLRSRAETRRIPRLSVLGDADPEARLASLRAGADDATAQPSGGPAFLARIRSHLRAADAAQALDQREATVREFGFAEAADSFSAPARVVVVCDDGGRAELLRCAADAANRQTVTLSRDLALAEADEARVADIFVIDAPCTHPGDALDLLAELRSRPRTRHAGILVVHDAADAETATRALDQGASDLVQSDFHPAELALRVEIQLGRKKDGDRLRASVDDDRRLAITDPLTGLFNRRYALGHARRAGASGGGAKGYCVILADIDRFKAVNDTYGHAAGDAVLAAVARRLRDNVRSVDMIARIGGEEFLVFLPDPDPAAARAAAMRLCAELRAAPVELSDGRPPIPVTASFGVAAAEPGEALETVIKRADDALYASKSAGRNTVTLAGTCAA